jgi:anti-anti-sigma factor
MVETDPTPRTPEELTQEDREQARITSLASHDVRLDVAQIGGEVYVVSMSGEGDLHAVPALERELQHALDHGARRVLVDLAAAYFVDSAFLGLLLKYQKRIMAMGGVLVIVSDDPRVRKTFELTGLDRAFSLEASLTEAVNRLVETPG